MSSDTTPLQQTSKYLERDAQGNFVFRVSGTEWVPTLLAVLACVCFFCPCCCIPMLVAAMYFQGTQMYMDEQKRELQIFNVGVFWRKALRETVSYDDVADFDVKYNYNVKINDQTTGDLTLITKSNGARIVLGTDVYAVQQERLTELKQHFSKV